MKSDRDKNKGPRTTRRVSEAPRAAVQPAIEPAAATVPTPEPATAESARDDAPRTVRKLALIYADGERSFDTSRMERSTIDRFRAAYRNTPELHPDGDAAADESMFDVSALIAKGYELIFGSAAALAVRARKLTPQQATAFINQERIAKLVPRTERALAEKFGDRVRNLPPLAQLAIDIVATTGLMLQDAAQMTDDEPAPGAPRVAPGAPVAVAGNRAAGNAGMH